MSELERNLIADETIEVDSNGNISKTSILDKRDNKQAPMRLDNIEKKIQNMTKNTHVNKNYQQNFNDDIELIFSTFLEDQKGKLDPKTQVLDAFKDWVGNSTLDPTKFTFDINDLKGYISDCCMLYLNQNAEENEAIEALFKKGENVLKNEILTSQSALENLKNNSRADLQKLQPGDKKNWISSVQTLLQESGYKLGKFGANNDGIDGILGPATQQAVREFQSGNGLKVDGLPGPDTIKALLANKPSQQENKPPQQENESPQQNPADSTLPPIEKVKNVEVPLVTVSQSEKALQPAEEIITENSNTTKPETTATKKTAGDTVSYEINNPQNTQSDTLTPLSQKQIPLSEQEQALRAKQTQISVDAQKQFKEGNYQEALDLSLKAENYYQAIETIKRTPPKVTLKINGININREQAIEDLKKLHSTKTETQKTQAIQAIEETQGNTEGTLTDTIGVLYNAMNYLTNENNTHKINPDKFLIMLTKRNPFTKKAQLKNSSIADENYKINKNENKALTHIKEAIKMFGSKNLKKALQLCNEAFANGEKKPDGSQLGIGIDTKTADNFYGAYLLRQTNTNEYPYLEKLIAFLEKELVGKESEIKDMYTNNYTYRIQKKDIKKHKNEYNQLSDNEKKNLNEQGVTKSDYAKFLTVVEKLNNNQLSGENGMLALMSDFNFDGVNDFIDGGGVKRGLQIKNIYTSAVVDLEYLGKDKNEATKNLIAFTQHIHGKDFFGTKTPTNATELFEWMKQNIRNTKLIQNTLVNSPIDAANIFKYGKEAFNHQMEEFRLSPQEKADLDARLNTQGGISKLAPAAKEHLQTTLASYIAETFRNPDVRTNANRGGVGASIPLNTLLKGLSLNLGVGVSNTEEKTNGILGVSLARNTNINVSDSVRLIPGAHVGTTLGFIPLYGARLGGEIDINRKKLETSIGPTALQTITFGPNITMIGPIPSRGFDAGFKVDKLKGIEIQYEKIRNESTELGKNIINKLVEKNVLGNESESKKVITEFLKDKYKNSTDEDLQKATDNIFTAFKYFNLNAKADKLTKETAAKLLGDFYALSWKNEAIAGLPDKWRLSGGSIGIQFLAGFYPIPTVAIQLTKYHSMYYEDTKQSQEWIDSRLNTGVGNEKRSETMTQKEIDYINNMLATLGISDLPKLTLVNNGTRIAIPKTLIKKNVFTINVSDELKGYVNKSPDEALLFPTETLYRLADISRGELKQFVLNIGDTKNETSDVKDIGSLLGNQEWLPAKEIKQGTLNNKIKEIIQQNPNFPIENANITNGVIQFTGKTGTTINGLVLDTTLNRNIIQPTYPSNGTITIQKNIDGSFSINHTPGTNNLTLEYKETTTDLSNTPITFDTTLLNSLRLINDPTFVQKLSKLDDNNLKVYGKFLKNARESSEDLEQATSELLKLIPDTSDYTDLRSILSDSSRKAEHAIIIDKMKQIFALDANATSTKSLPETISQRGNIYKEMRGANGQVFPQLSGDPRANILNKLTKHQGTLDRELDPSLVGFTAFYRKNLSNDTLDKNQQITTLGARGMSMTSLGATTILGGANGKEVLTDPTDIENAKKRLLGGGEHYTPGNLEKNTAQFNSIKEQLKDKLGVKELINERAIKLLKGEALDIDGKKITLNVEYVFYLLGECANESIGLSIKGINIESNTDASSVTIPPENVEETGFVVNTAETTSAAFIKRTDKAFAVTGGAKKKREDPKTPPGETGGGDDERETGGGDDGLQNNDVINNGDNSNETNQGAKVNDVDYLDPLGDTKYPIENDSDPLGNNLDPLGNNLNPLLRVLQSNRPRDTNKRSISPQTK